MKLTYAMLVAIATTATAIDRINIRVEGNTVTHQPNQEQRDSATLGVWKWCTNRGGNWLSHHIDGNGYFDYTCECAVGDTPLPDYRPPEDSALDDSWSATMTYKGPCAHEYDVPWVPS
ncbi:hypothetical protein E4U55_007856 [Claviceps digitariae]|nr:hypothetical protein E4U55_007856 [Claviceps digitariae]